MRRQKIPRDPPRPAQARLGHGGKQVMLDVIVEATEHEVLEAGRAEVAGGQDLVVQDRDVLAGLDDSGADMVDQEDGA